VYKKDIGRVKCALVFTYSHLTLNNTGGGWEVHLPENHALTPTQERQLREFALTYSNVYDDVIANKGVAGTACEEEPEQEEGQEQQEEAATDAKSDGIINGVGDWQDE
jgi:hypothetical protein